MVPRRFRWRPRTPAGIHTPFRLSAHPGVAALGWTRHPKRLSSERPPGSCRRFPSWPRALPESLGRECLHPFDRPSPGAMAEGELEPCTGCFDLEERSRPGHDREGGALISNTGDLQDWKTSAVERDLARPAIKPVGSDPDLDRFDSDHRHFAAPFGGATRAPVTGHWCRERLFGFDVRLDRTGVRCQALLRRRRHPPMAPCQLVCHDLQCASDRTA